MKNKTKSETKSKKLFAVLDESTEVHYILTSRDKAVEYAKEFVQDGDGDVVVYEMTPINEVKSVVAVVKV
jgi:hypothetical protein